MNPFFIILCLRLKICFFMAYLSKCKLLKSQIRIPMSMFGYARLSDVNIKYEIRVNFLFHSQFFLYIAEHYGTLHYITRISRSWHALILECTLKAFSAERKNFIWWKETKKCNTFISDLDLRVKKPTELKMNSSNKQLNIVLSHIVLFIFYYLKKL